MSMNINLLKKVTGLAGVVTLASLVSLPAMAQTVSLKKQNLQTVQYDQNSQFNQNSQNQNSQTGISQSGSLNPRPAILNEPLYDGNPSTGLRSGAVPVAPSSTPSLSGTNPQPSIFNEARYDGIYSGPQVPVAPTTPSLSQTNPNPQVLNEPRYDGVPSSQTGQAAPATTPAQGTRPTAAVTPLDRELMIMAAHSNNAEIITSQLALQRSRNEAIRQYAQQMIQEHTLANRQLAERAARYGITLPSDAGPLNNALAQQLAQLSGTEFDQAYMAGQAASHVRTLGLLQTALTQSRNPDVRSYAAQILPSVQNHYQVAERLSPSYNALDFRQLEGQGGMNHMNMNMNMNQPVR